MQVQGELQAAGTYERPYRSMSHAFVVIARNEGLAGIQKGLTTLVVVVVILVVDNARALSCC